MVPSRRWRCQEGALPDVDRQDRSLDLDGCLVLVRIVSEGCRWRESAAMLRRVIRLLPLLLIVLALPPVPAAAATTTVCATSCDTLDPSRAQQETFPLPDKNINGRKVQLHVSVPDGMAWASIDQGTAG